MENSDKKQSVKDFSKNKNFGKNSNYQRKSLIPEPQVEGAVEVSTTPMPEHGKLPLDKASMLTSHQQMITTLLNSYEPKDFFNLFRPIQLVTELNDMTRVVLDTKPILENERRNDSLSLEFNSLRNIYARGLNWILDGLETLLLYSPQTMMLGGKIIDVPFKVNYLEHKSRPILGSYGDQNPQAESGILYANEKISLPFFGQQDIHKMQTMARGSAILGSHLVSARLATNYKITGTERYLVKNFKNNLLVHTLATSRLHTKLVWRMYDAYPITLAYAQSDALKAFPGGLIANNRILGALGGADLQVTQAAGIEFGNMLVTLIKSVIFDDVTPKLRIVEDTASLYTAWTPIYTVIAAAYTYQFIPDGIELVNAQVYIKSLTNFLQVQKTVTNRSVAALTTLLTVAPTAASTPYIVASGHNSDTYTSNDVIVKMTKFATFAKELIADLAGAQKGRANVNSMIGAPKNFLEALGGLSESSGPRTDAILWIAKIARQVRRFLPTSGAKSSQTASYYVDISPHKAFGFASTLATPSITRIPDGLKNLGLILAEHALEATYFLSTFRKLYNETDQLGAGSFKDTLLSTSHSLLINALTDFMALVPRVQKNLYLNELILNQAREELYVDRLPVSFIFTDIPAAAAYTPPSVDATFDSFDTVLTIDDIGGQVRLNPKTLPPPPTSTIAAFNNTDVRPLTLRIQLRGVFGGLTSMNLAEMYPDLAYPIMLNNYSLEEILKYFSSNLYVSVNRTYKLTDNDDRLALNWLSPPSQLFVLSVEEPKWKRSTFHSTTSGLFGRTNVYTVDYRQSTYTEVTL